MKITRLYKDRTAREENEATSGAKRDGSNYKI